MKVFRVWSSSVVVFPPKVTALLAAEDAGFCRLHAEQTEFVAS